MQKLNAKKTSAKHSKDARQPTTRNKEVTGDGAGPSTATGPDVVNADADRPQRPLRPLPHRRMPLTSPGPSAMNEDGGSSSQRVGADVHDSGHGQSSQASATQLTQPVTKPSKNEPLVAAKAPDVPPRTRLQTAASDTSAPTLYLPRRVG